MQKKVAKKVIKKRKKMILKKTKILEKKIIIIQFLKVINKYNNMVDVCTILKKCSIDEISKYLSKREKKKFSRYNKKK